MLNLCFWHYLFVISIADVVFFRRTVLWREHRSDIKLLITVAEYGRTGKYQNPNVSAGWGFCQCHIFLVTQLQVYCFHACIINICYKFINDSRHGSRSGCYQLTLGAILSLLASADGDGGLSHGGISGQAKDGKSFHWPILSSMRLFFSSVLFYAWFSSVPFCSLAFLQCSVCDVNRRSIFFFTVSRAGGGKYSYEH